MEQGPEYENFNPEFELKKGKEAGEEKTKRTIEQQREMARKISLIARIFSRQYDMDVLPSNMWGCGLDEKTNEVAARYCQGEIADIDGLDAKLFKPRVITYDRSSLEKEREDAIIGKMRHEVGHAKNSDYRLLLKGMKFAKDQGYLPTSWTEIANAIEDPWVNNIEIADSETVRQKINTLYEQWKEDTTKLIGSQPVTHQLSLNIINYWLTGESIPTLKNEDVLKVFKEIEPSLEKLFSAKTPAENFKTIKEEVWDKYKALEKKAIGDEEMKKMMEAAAKDLIKQLSGGEQGDEQQQGEGEGGLLQKIKEKLGGKSKSQKEEDELLDSLSGQIGSKTKKDIRDSLKKQVDEQKEEKGETKEGEEEKPEPKEEGLSGGSLRKDIDLDKLPQELKDQLRELIDKKLPSELRSELNRQAKSELDRKQAELLNKQLPDFIKMKRDKKSGQYIPEFQTPDKNEVDNTKKEVDDLVEQSTSQEAEETERQARQIEEQKIREREEAERLRQEREMEKYGFKPEETEDYQKFKELENAMRSQVENFIKILDKYLPKKEEYKYAGEFHTGKKIDFKKLTKKVPVGKSDFFQRREIKESTEAKLYVTLVIDNSGSMSGQKMAESLKTAIFFARVLKRFEIPFAIKFFGDHVERAKEFDEDYDDPRKRIKPKIVTLSDASGQHTDISEPLLMTETEMAQAKREFSGSSGAIFVISDGGANRGRVGDELKNYIEQLQKTYMINAFGLGAGAANELKGYFGEQNTVAVDDFQELPNEAFKVLRVALERILKRLRKI